MPYTLKTCVRAEATHIDPVDSSITNIISPNYIIADCSEFYHDANFGAKCKTCKNSFKHTDDDKNCISDTTVVNCK